MEGDLNHPAPSSLRTFTSNTTSSSSSSSSLSSFSPPRFVRDVQNAFKRHRPLGTMRSSNIKPRRKLVAQRGTLKTSLSNLGPTEDLKNTQNEVSNIQPETVSSVPVLNESQIEDPITIPSISGTIIHKYEENKQFDAQSDRQRSSVDYKNNEPSASSLIGLQNIQLVDCQKVHFSSGDAAGSYKIDVDVDVDISNKREAAISLRPDEANKSFSSKELEDPSVAFDNSNIGKTPSNISITDLQTLPSLAKNPSSNTNIEPSKPEKQQKPGNTKAAPRKRGYDPDLFFKVNGKLYQRLGKIGSGGSSEVHKVISSDCHIYALKKIKLKGRDYATAYGFCQEIDYLNKLKGKSNIIQLIDYEVTDKTLLQEVLNGSCSKKDGRVKEDGHIFMVLEYGEIDLAHMLSQKFKEMDITNSTIDENWLRFYWQQILLAVNTIHEERIVHSDLKLANFLLVRGSLKLIDFGIAKAIMSDTTNIQRDSQVGTLSYMSPEAFMCNETDSNGSIIKCGRSSDIWSLGCILYQMVYGQTPFSEYKTFWAKYKVITDPNYEIKYEPVSNPWLIDLMKKCLVWDRNKRWKISQLLKHPFLDPPVAPQLNNSEGQLRNLLQLIDESCSNNPKALLLCRQLRELLMDYKP